MKFTLLFSGEPILCTSFEISLCELVFNFRRLFYGYERFDISQRVCTTQLQASLHAVYATSSHTLNPRERGWAETIYLHSS